jgi:secreted PhoX family phosphatase
MTKRTYLLFALAFSCLVANAQTLFDNEITIPAGYAPTTVVMPPSPLSMQILFIGGVDMVQSTPTYGNPAGEEVAKEWHDFIGITPDASGQSQGWVTVNHEMIYASNKLGDGGGMTSFKIARKADGTLEILNQTLNDGRTGKFFNVDFVNTTGETGMNCGGINSIVDGRIWTAEEWFQEKNLDIFNGGNGVRDTSDFTVTNSDIPGMNGRVLKKYQNFNYMTEIDPKQAKAIRKQYNWGRQGFEGGVIAPDNRIVYLGPDDVPGFFGMFVANTPGDFTKGTLFAYKHDKAGWKWVPIWEPGLMLNHQALATQKGCTMFNRIEWVAMNPDDNFIYFTETGLDNPVSAWADNLAAGGVFHPATVARAQANGWTGPTDPNYRDFYGRIWKYDPRTAELSVYLEGGPVFADSPTEANYPAKHLSNPDGLNVIKIDGRSFLAIQEDLNGTSRGRVPAGVTNRTCEMFLLDLSIQNPTVNDLIRLTAVPAGAEVTGVVQTPDGKSLLINSQHPRTDNPFPYNHSLTFAIHGLDQIDYARLSNRSQDLDPEMAKNDENAPFSVYPNPVTRVVFMNKTTDVALYDANGKRVLVQRNTNQLDVSSLPTGVYYLKNADGETLKLSVQ